MKSISTLFRNVEDMKELMEVPKWVISFRYTFLDEAGNVDLDLGALMLHFGYTEEYALCTSYYKKYPNSLAMPKSDGIDAFFQHLINIGVYSKTAPLYALEQEKCMKHLYPLQLHRTALSAVVLFKHDSLLI